MTAAILCYAILVLIPVLTLLRGLKIQKSAGEPGSKDGYPAEYAPKSAEAWSYTQKLAGMRCILFSILMLVCGVGFMQMMPYTDIVSLLCCAGVALGLEIVVLLMGLFSIGMTLQGHFKSASV